MMKGLWSFAFLVGIAGASQAAIFDVQIENFSFNSNNLTISVGDTVRWTNFDGAPHTTSSLTGPESWDSGTLLQTQTFEKVFTVAGDYSYRCNIHTGMRGAIRVQAVPEPATFAAVGLGVAALLKRRKK